MLYVQTIKSSSVFSKLSFGLVANPFIDMFILTGVYFYLLTLRKIFLP